MPPCASCWAWAAASGLAAAASPIRPPTSVGSRVNSTDRKAAVPIVPPIWRKKVTDEVATPISRGETAFCTARMTGWKLKPSPSPIMTMNGTMTQIEVSALTTTDSDSSAITISATPTSGKVLYFPVFEIVVPEMMPPLMMPSTNGVICSPATVALEPCTICRYWGSRSSPPNMPAPMTIEPTPLTVKVRLRNSRSGSRASSR